MPPHFKKEPKDVRVPLGGSARFDCQADGKPLPNISWTDEDLNPLTDPRYTQFTNGTLWITDVQDGDVGTYYCFITITFDLHKKATLFIGEPADSSSDNKIGE